MSRLLVNDLVRHAAALKAGIADAVDRVLASGWYVLGQEGLAFEREFAAYCGVGHCVGVANGTDALELSFRALGIGSGSRVATVANAGGYASAALELVGATPIYVDVRSEDHLMDLEALERVASSGQLDAVVVTHLFGRLHDMTAVRSMARSTGISIIEDCAQAHGAAREGRRAGSFGDLACFSFYPTKNLGALGDAGAVTTEDPALAERLRGLRQYGWETKYLAVQRGGRNSRLDEIQAAVLRAKLPSLDGWNARRRAIAARFSQGIKHKWIKCPEIPGEDHVAHLYVVLCDDRESLRRHLADADIHCDVHYPIPDHLQPARQRPGEDDRLKVTEDLAQRVLTLPCFPELTDREVDYIVERVNAWR
jgi:aminotransferase EvaB